MFSWEKVFGEIISGFIKKGWTQRRVEEKKPFWNKYHRIGKNLVLTLLILMREEEALLLSEALKV